MMKLNPTHDLGVLLAGLCALSCTTSPGDVGSTGAATDASPLTGADTEPDPSTRGSGEPGTDTQPGPSSDTDNPGTDTSNPSTDTSNPGTDTGNPGTGTASGGACDIPSIRDVAASYAIGKDSPAMDCGIATSSDDRATWRAVHECVTGSIATSRSFFALFALEHPASPLIIGYSGVQGEVYGYTQIQCEPASDDAPNVRFCGEIARYPEGCEADVDQPCLACHPGVMVSDCSECDPGVGCLTRVAFGTESFCVTHTAVCPLNAFTCACASELCDETFSVCIDDPDHPNQGILCECPNC